jgi:hypothetical protein
VVHESLEVFDGVYHCQGSRHRRDESVVVLGHIWRLCGRSSDGARERKHLFIGRMQLLVRVVVGSSRRGGNDSDDFVSRHLYLPTQNGRSATYMSLPRHSF